MQTIELLKVFHDRLLSLAGTLRFNKRNPFDLHRVALYGTLIELTGCMIQLIEHNGRTGVPSLFRAFLEAAVELRNLAKDPTYIEHMTVSYEDQWLKVLKAAKKGNPYLASIATLPDLDAQIADHEKNIAEFATRRIQPLPVFCKFQRADMVNEYLSLYNFLSCDSHSNIRALISRHVDISPMDFKVVYYKDEPIETFLPILDSTAGLLVDTALYMHKAFESEKLGEVQKLQEDLKAVRTKYAL